MLSYSTCSRRIPPPDIDSHGSSLQNRPGGWLFLLATFLRRKHPRVLPTKINGRMYQKEDPLQFVCRVVCQKRIQVFFLRKGLLVDEKSMMIHVKLTESPLKMMIFPPNPESPFPVGYFPWFHGLLFTLADGDGIMALILLMVQKFQGQPPVGCIKHPVNNGDFWPYQLVIAGLLNHQS